MKKTAARVLLGAFVLIASLAAAPLFAADLSKRVFLYRLNPEKAKEIRDDFSLGEKIYVEFSFLPTARETDVEIRWINPLQKKEQVYFEQVQSPLPARMQTVVCWLLLSPSLYEKIVGSKFFGRWRVEIWLNDRQVAEQSFSVGN